MRRFSGQSLYAAAVLVVCCMLGAYVLLLDTVGEEGALAPLHGAEPGGGQTLESIGFDGRRAYEHLKALCDIGPRPSGSPGMQQQQALLIEHFGQLGGEVEQQRFRVRHPLSGEAVEMVNLVVRWHADRKERILLCAHYDTRPYPDRDPLRPRGRFVGANDGGSGVAVLMELARHLKDLKGRLGVDIVLFDGEELVFAEADRTEFYFQGSKYFARAYANDAGGYRYRCGVLLDMVGDADLRLDQEPNSLRYARGVMQEIWATARRLGVSEFSGRIGPQVNDDHVPLNQIARIPTVDIIDFDYPYWHTEGDVVERCSPLSLGKVGWVVLEWLRGAVR